MADGALMLDPRRAAVRPDLADAAFRDHVEAPRYASGEARVVAGRAAYCHKQAASNAPIDTEFLAGEPVRQFDEANGWAWVQSGVDGYVGYVRADTLGPPGPAPTHRVSVPLALIFSERSIKSPPLGTLPLCARVTAIAEAVDKEHFHELATGGFVLDQHLSRSPAKDWVAVAELYLGVPYLWGGKTFDGLDCSGLIQLALDAAHRIAPRDSDMQERELGEALPEDAPLTRGDLVFWKGHVGIMLDATRLLHANGHHMLTVVEPLATTAARLSAMGLPITGRRRLRD